MSMLREIKLRLWSFYGSGSPRNPGRPVHSRVELKKIARSAAATEEARRVMQNEKQRYGKNHGDK